MEHWQYNQDFADINEYFLDSSDISVLRAEDPSSTSVFSTRGLVMQSSEIQPNPTGAHSRAQWVLYLWSCRANKERKEYWRHSLGQWASGFRIGRYGLRKWTRYMICDGLYFLDFAISLKIRRDIVLCSSKLRIVCKIDAIVYHRFGNISHRKGGTCYYFDVGTVLHIKLQNAISRWFFNEIPNF